MYLEDSQMIKKKKKKAEKNIILPFLSVSLILKISSENIQQAHSMDSKIFIPTILF